MVVSGVSYGEDDEETNTNKHTSMVQINDEQAGKMQCIDHSDTGTTGRSAATADENRKNITGLVARAEHNCSTAMHIICHHSGDFVSLLSITLLLEYQVLKHQAMTAAAGIVLPRLLQVLRSIGGASG